MDSSVLTLLKYLGEIAPVVAVLGWWIISLQKALMEKDNQLKAKDERLEHEIDYTKERDKENLKAVIETAQVMKGLGEALKKSENVLSSEIRRSAETLEKRIELLGERIKNRNDQ